MPKTTSRRQSTAVRQEQIIDAARSLVIRYGSEHVTVRRIAKEVGISEGAIYRHFKSKRDILFLLVDHLTEDLLGDIGRGRKPEGSPLQTLQNLASLYLSPSAQKRGIPFQVIAEVVSLGDKKLNRKLFDAINDYTGRIKGILEEGVKSGEVRDDINLDAAATIYFGMIQSLVNIWTLGNYGFNLEERHAAIWRVFIEAVAKTPAATDAPAGAW